MLSSGRAFREWVAAHLLSRRHEVVVFETQGYVGEHTHTIDVTYDGVTYPIDTGFMVFNRF